VPATCLDGRCTADRKERGSVSDGFGGLGVAGVTLRLLFHLMDLHLLVVGESIRLSLEASLVSSFIGSTGVARNGSL